MHLNKKDENTIKRNRLLVQNEKDIKALTELYFELGEAYLNLKRINLALETFEKALVYGKKYFGEENLFITDVYTNIAHTYFLLEDYNKALFYHKKSYFLEEKLLHIADKKRIDTLYAIGENYVFLEQKNEALEPLTRALKMSVYLYGEQSAYSAKINSLLASLPEGEVNFKILLNTYKRQYGSKSLEVAQIYASMASEFEIEKKHEEALTYHKLSLEIYLKYFSSVDKRVFMGHYKIALSYKKNNDNEKYFTHINKAFDGFSKNQELIFSTLSIADKKAYLQKYKSMTKHLFLASLKGHSKSTFNHWINYKRKLFDEENSLALLTLKVEEKVKLKMLLEKKRALARLYQQEVYTEDEVKKLQKMINKLEEFFSLKYFFYKKSSKKSTISHKDISRELKEKELYIDFAKIEQKYYIFTLNKNEELNFLSLTKEETEKVDDIIERIREGRRDIPLKATQQRYALLYDLIITKLDVEDSTSLIISPDGLLSTIPFEAFYDEKEKQYLLEKFSVRYIPSAKELVKLYQNDAKSNEKIIVFSEVDFGEQRSSESKRRENLYKNMSWSTLKYSIAESKNIKRLYPESQLFLKKEASEENLFNVKSPKILHLATHGTFSSYSKISNPLLKSFIFLSDANNGMDNHSGKGIVSALELSGLNLRGTELVVLSACETAVGKVEEFEGVATLSKAFMYAGANNIVMSLWNIDDKATAQLIGNFYHALNEGDVYHEALRRAKILMMKNQKFSHPYFWAGLIISGK